MHSAHLSVASFGMGILGLGGLGLPLIGTFGGNPGAAVYGLDATLAPVLWALPLAGLGAVGVAFMASRQRRWLVVTAAVGMLAFVIGAGAIGATPWA